MMNVKHRKGGFNNLDDSLFLMIHDFIYQIIYINNSRYLE